MGDGGSWLRRQCIVMAKDCNTPVDYWLQLPLASFISWIRDHNDMVREENQRREAAQKQRRGRR